jgi:hypothetical protein
MRMHSCLSVLAVVVAGNISAADEPQTWFQFTFTTGKVAPGWTAVAPDPPV